MNTANNRLESDVPDSESGRGLQLIFDALSTKIESLEERLETINQIAGQANQAIRAGRFDELRRYQQML